MDMPVNKPTDKFDRPLRDLRISVTDRCNFRCTYCMPKDLFGPDHAFLPRSNILSFEEIDRIVRLFTQLGVKKIRITGGEPLIRRDLNVLIEKIRNIEGIEDISLTTNGALLTRKFAESLVSSGLNRITVSLDALDDGCFRKVVDARFPVKRVLQAIDNAGLAGLEPVKVNMVVMKNVNQDQILPMVEYFRQRNVILRFIEFMDVGTTNEWQYDKVVDAGTIINTINDQYPIEPVAANYKGEVAKRWRYKDGQGEIGVIASVSQPFCRGCHRARLSAEGNLYTCLFASSGFDLRHALREQPDDRIILDEIANLWRNRSDRYSEVRGQDSPTSRKVEMSYIGG